MNLWLLTSEFPPLHGGGISTYCVETAKMFSSYGHDVTVITPDFNISKLTFEKKEQYTVVRFNPSKYYTFSFLGYDANLSFAFAGVVKALILEQGEPDIIEAHEYNGIAYYLLQYKHLQYAEFKNLKILITLHAPSFLYLEYNKVSCYQHPHFWVGEMEKFCIRAADLIISPSRFLIDELKSRLKLDDINIHVIKNPYNISWQLPENKIEKNKVVFFGKLIPQKGCLELINYFQSIWKEDVDLPLYMIGGGDHLYHPEGVDMIDYIKKKHSFEIKSGKLKLLGSILPNQISEHLKDANIIVIPSVIDNLPYTVLEAMSRGKIVLASIQGGQSEIIQNDKNGFLFDHKNPESFGLQIKHILSLPTESVKTIEQNAYNEIKNEYSYLTIYKQKNSLLEQLLIEKKDANTFPFIRPEAPLLLTPERSRRGKGIKGEAKAGSLLTVVIPYYNMGKYIGETITSIQNSTYKNVEIIIVNDGSTEAESVDALNKFKANQQIKIIHKKNEGLALARNTGALQANGDYLAFLDPDDTVEKEYYSKAILVLSTFQNVFFVGCWAKYFGAANGYWPSFNPEPPYLLVHNMINSSALIYKKEAFLNFGLNDPKMIYGMEDYESVINIVKNGYKGVVLPEPLWNYRIRKDSMARAFTKEKQIYLYRLIADKHRDFYSLYASEITNLLNANGPGINYDNPTLIYDLPGNNWLGLKIKNKIISIIKTNPLIRKIAIRAYKIYKQTK